MIDQKSPLEGIALGTTSRVAMRELPHLPAVDLRVAPGSLTQTVLTETLGITFSGSQGGIRFASFEKEAYALGLGPDWWLIIQYPGTEQKLAPLLTNDQCYFSAVDVSSQRTTIELEGPDAREVLAHLWEQDLREKSFPVGSVSQGLMAKAPVIVCHMAPFRYRIMVRSSFALHLWKALADAATEWI